MEGAEHFSDVLHGTDYWGNVDTPDTQTRCSNSEIL